MSRRIGYLELNWASNHLNSDEYERARKYFAGQTVPDGEYIDGATGEYVVICQPDQAVPAGTVYISEQSLRDEGVQA